MSVSWNPAQWSSVTFLNCDLPQSPSRLPASVSAGPSPWLWGVGAPALAVQGKVQPHLRGGTPQNPLVWGALVNATSPDVPEHSSQPCW